MIVLWYDANHVDLLLPRDKAKTYPLAYQQMTVGPTMFTASSKSASRGLKRVSSHVSPASVFTEPSTKPRSQRHQVAQVACTSPADPFPCGLAAAGSVFTRSRTASAAPPMQARSAPATVWTHSRKRKGDASVASTVCHASPAAVDDDSEPIEHNDLRALPKADGFREAARAAGRKRLVNWCSQGCAKCQGQGHAEWSPA